MKHTSIIFKNYCNDENLKLYKKLKLYNVIKTRVNHMGMIDYDEEKLRFIGSHKLVGYYYGNVADYKINLLSEDKFNTVCLMIFLRMEDSYNDTFKLTEQLKLPKDINLLLNVDFVKKLKERKILLLFFK